MTSRSKKTRALVKLLPFVGVVLLSILIFLYVDPDQIISTIGFKNAYGLMFVFAALGGLTTFNTVPYYSLLLLLAAAGLNPLLLGLASALGVMTGDSFSYLLGRQGSEAVPDAFRAFLERVRIFAKKHPRIFPFACFLYGSISPLSNDLITLPAGMAGIPYLYVMIPLAVGNIVFNVTLSYLAVYAHGVVSIFIGG